MSFSVHVSISNFFTIRQKRIRGGGAFAKGNSASLNVADLQSYHYAASVWDPHVTKHKQAIQRVQRRAARWVTNQHYSMSSVTAMLQELDWQPLELRRAHSRLGLMYQITNGTVATPHIPYILSQVMLLVHHDMRTHCNMRHTNAGQTILNILTSLIQ